MHISENNKLFALKNAGLDDKEVKVYISLLELGKTSVMEISKESGIDRTTCYRMLQNLLKIPLVQTLKEDKKTRWAALNPSYLIDYVNKRRDSIKEVFPDLQAIYNLDEEKPKLTYFEGIPGLQKSTADIIREVKHRGEILSFSTPGAAAGYYSQKEFLHLAQERVSKQIMSRILIPTIEGAPGYIEGEDWKNWRHVKVVDDKKMPFKATINVWNNKISILIIKSHPIGVVIESKDLADTMKDIFEVLWAMN